MFLGQKIVKYLQFPMAQAKHLVPFMMYRITTSFDGTNEIKSCDRKISSVTKYNFS